MFETGKMETEMEPLKFKSILKLGNSESNPTSFFDLNIGSTLQMLVKILRSSSPGFQFYSVFSVLTLFSQSPQLEAQVNPSTLANAVENLKAGNRSRNSELIHIAGTSVLPRTDNIRQGPGPEILIHPQDQGTVVGHTTTFFVDAVNSQGERNGLTYQWLVENTPIDGADNSFFSPGKLTKSNHHSKINVVVSENGAEVVSNPAILNVYATNELFNKDLSFAELSGAEFMGLDLRLTNLTFADLKSANLNHANLFRAQLTGADLSGANLSEADLVGADLSGADLTGADLTGADLSGVDLSGAELIGTGLGGVDLTDADLSGADLTGADLSHALIYNTDLAFAQLIGVDLREAVLSGANLTFSKLSGADLTGSDVNNIDFGSAVFDQTIMSDGSIRTGEDGLDLIDPVLIWIPPNAITYGEALGDMQLSVRTEVSGSLIYSSPAGTILNAGNYSLRVSFIPSDSSKFKSVSTSIDLIVKKAQLTIIAEDKTREEGEENPPLTARYVGFVEGDGPSNLEEQPQLSTVGDIASPAGTHLITIGGVEDENYDITYQEGALTITSLTLEVTLKIDLDILAGKVVVLWRNRNGLILEVASTIAGPWYQSGLTSRDRSSSSFTIDLDLGPLVSIPKGEAPFSRGMFFFRTRDLFATDP